MERWSGRVALVTGASSGIGAAIAKDLALQGMKVIGVSPDVERIEAMKSVIQGAPGKLYPLKCDVTKEEDILAVFEWATKNLGGVDVLINNAGVAPPNANLAHSATEPWRNILNVNVLGLSICSREAIKSMQARGVNDGHVIIHINSVLGHKVVGDGRFGMYSASKHAVTALREALNKELIALNSRIKVTSLSPGLVNTEIAESSFFKAMPFLEASDIADAVVYILGCPENVLINELTIEPV